MIASLKCAMRVDESVICGHGQEGLPGIEMLELIPGRRCVDWGCV